MSPCPALLSGIAALAQPGALLEMRLNLSALSTVGQLSTHATQRIWPSLRQAGFRLDRPRMLTAQELRDCPTTWARRQAFGRQPRTLYLSGPWAAGAGRAAAPA